MSAWKILPLLALPALTFANSWEGDTNCPEAMCQFQNSTSVEHCVEKLTSFTCRKTKLDGENVITYIDGSTYRTDSWGIQVFGEDGTYQKTIRFPEHSSPNRAVHRQAAFMEDGSLAVLSFDSQRMSRTYAGGGVESWVVEGVGMLEHVDFYDKNLRPLITFLNTNRSRQKYEISSPQISFVGNQLVIAGDDGKNLVINPVLNYEAVKQAYLEKHIRLSIRFAPRLTDNYLRLVPRYQAAFDACTELEGRQIARCLGRAKRPFIRELQRAMDPIIAGMTDATDELRATRAYFRKDNAWDSGDFVHRVFTSNEILSQDTTRTVMPLPVRGQGAYAMTMDGLLLIQTRGRGTTPQYFTGGGFNQNIVEWNVETNPNMSLE